MLKKNVQDIAARNIAIIHEFGRNYVMNFQSIATKSRGAFFITVSLLFGQFAFAADAPIQVNVDNFVRAETASQFDRLLETYVGGKVNTWAHIQTPAPIDNQTVIRMNRDTLYSAIIVDISKGATLTIPDTGDRYMSIMIVNEDHYINRVYHEAGTYDLTMDVFHTALCNGQRTYPG